MNELDEWWSRLKVTEKLRIASKVYHDDIESYKEATRIWMLLPDERKQDIKNHVTDSHGVVHGEWIDNDNFGC